MHRAAEVTGGRRRRRRAVRRRSTRPWTTTSAVPAALAALHDVGARGQHSAGRRRLDAALRGALGVGARDARRPRPRPARRRGWAAPPATGAAARRRRRARGRGPRAAARRPAPARTSRPPTRSATAARGRGPRRGHPARPALDPRRRGLMAGNSQRQGRQAHARARKKGATVGSRRPEVARGCAGRGPTPQGRAERTKHAAAKRSATAAPPRRSGAGRRRAPAGRAVVAGGPADGAARAPRSSPAATPWSRRCGPHVPATALYVGRPDRRRRPGQGGRPAGRRGRGCRCSRRRAAELDRMTAGAVHQGLALQVPPYEYAHPDDLLAPGRRDGRRRRCIVALDGVTDPRNLGAVVRSAAAFGAHGVVVPERRAAGMTAAAWKTSAGAAARIPVARATNLTRAAGDVPRGRHGRGRPGRRRHRDAADLEVATDPLVVVVGVRGRRAVPAGGAQPATCWCASRWPAGNESLNAGVAAGIVLYEVARHRAERRRR